MGDVCKTSSSEVHDAFYRKATYDIWIWDVMG